MTEISREEVESISQGLEEKIRLVAQSLALLPEPFSKFSMLKVRKGGTGASILRRIPLTYSGSGEQVLLEADTEGNFNTWAHLHLDDAANEILFYNGVVIPTDYIAFSSSMSFNYMYSNDGTTGNVNWDVVVETAADTSTAKVSLLNTGSTSVAVPAVADTMSIRSIPFTTLPKTNTVLFSLIHRLGVADSNNDTVSVWAAWIEYLAFI